MRHSFKGVFERKVLYISAFLSFLVGFIFYWIFKYTDFTDLKSHILLYQDLLAEGKLPVPPLYYWTIDVIDRVFRYKYEFVSAAFLVLTLSVVGKFLLVKVYMVQEKNEKLNWLEHLFLAGLLFFFPIYTYTLEGEFWYLGKFTPNIWHNSTTIFVFPFCILLFLSSLKWIETKEGKWLLAQMILGVLVLITKPSFLFVFIPALPFAYLLYNKKLDLHFLLGVANVGFLFLGVLAQKWLLYDNNLGNIPVFSLASSSKVVVAPLQVWENYTENKFLDVLSSFLFLLVCGLIYGKRLFKDYQFVFALMMVFGSIMIFLTFAESGERMRDANFYWQVPISMFILNMVIAKHLLPIKPFNRKSLFCHFVFLLHVITGFLYLFRLMFLDRYQ
jgi:hypothetical protein